MRYKYIIPGDPVPWARPRMNRGRFYDSQTKEKITLASHVRIQHRDYFNLQDHLFSGPLHIEVFFFMRTPKGSARKVAEYENKYHSCRPDFSNLLKFIEDAVHDVLYADDCIISSVVGTKKYSNSPRTEIVITELKE